MIYLKGNHDATPFSVEGSIKKFLLLLARSVKSTLSASQNPSLDALATLPKTYQICSAHHDQQLVFPRVFARASVSNTVR